jgi:uncharacterized protein with HEPN domain
VPSSDPAQRFADIIDNIDHIKRFTQELDAETFIGKDQVIFAVKYALMIISEAAIRLGETAPALQPDIPWREIRGMGNRLRHEYDTIDLARIWLLIERDLMPLRAACQDALRTLLPQGPTPHT